MSDGWGKGLAALDEEARKHRLDGLAEAIEQSVGHRAELSYELHDDVHWVRVRLFVGAAPPGRGLALAETAHRLNYTLAVGKITLPDGIAVAYEMAVPGDYVTPESIGQAAVALTKLAKQHEAVLDEVLAR